MTKINKYALKQQLNEILKADKKITIEFNCGNDEAHIVPFIDGQIVEYGDLYENLEILIYQDLNLPSDGEYKVTGNGYLTLENNDIFLFYDLNGFTYQWDEDEEICNMEDYEPKKNITDKMKDKYLLISRDFDDPSKLEEYVKSLNETSETIQNRFSKADQQIWDDLGGFKPKPWWKFW